MSAATLDSAGRVKVSGQDVPVYRIAQVDSIAALKALTGASDKDCRLVPMWGLYRYDASSSATADDKIVLAPDTLPGRWINDTAYAITYLI